MGSTFCLFQRDVADDEGTLSVTFLKVEGVGNGIERFEGKREVFVAQVAHEVFGGIRSFHGGIIGLIKRNPVGCRQFVLLAVRLKIGILDDGLA